MIRYLADNSFLELDKKKKAIICFFIPFLIFTIFYWNSALSKPFHVDEFFSWVYAERCTFREILTLKDAGIGHPPLFHLIQKTVQTIFPEYQPYQVRLANYFIGLAFLVLLISILDKKGSVPIFYYGIASSACILNVFIFSRMWGLICLFSMLLILTGENYLKDNSKTKLSLFLLTGILGFLADYNFVLMIPYMLIVVISRHRAITCFKGSRLVGIILIILAGICLASILRINDKISYYLLNSIPIMLFETGNMIFNFWYVETFLVSILGVCLIYYLNNKETHTEGKKWSAWSIHTVLAIGSLIIMAALIRYVPVVRIRYLAPMIIGVGCYMLFCLLRGLDEHVEQEEISRYIKSIIFGVLILLAINPFVWRDLRETRFVIVLLPFFLLIIYRSLKPKYLSCLGVIFLISGILYSFSNVLSDLTPSPALKNQENVVYQNIFTYSDQYLKYDKRNGKDSYMLDLSDFQKHCRICAVGNSDIQFDKYISITISGRNDFKAKGSLAKDFEAKGTMDIGVTWLDGLQGRYFTYIPSSNPLNKTILYHYTRKENNDVGHEG